MEALKYSLTVIKTDEGTSVQEENQLTDFEVMGILSHLIQQHSINIIQQQEEYERQSSIQKDE